MSGPATGAGAVALPLPVRVLNAPFARAARVRTSGMLDALLSGRGWIALVFVLLAGIVFFNVDLMQMNRDIAQSADRISALKRENARLLLEEARLAGSERVQSEAAKLGLVLPAPGEVRYLKARPGADARRAAQSITIPEGYVHPSQAEGGGAAADADADAGGQGAAGTETAQPGDVTLDPVTGLPIDPATGQTAYDPNTGQALDPTTGQPYQPAGAEATGASATGDTEASAAGDAGTSAAGDPAAGSVVTTSPDPAATATGE